MGDSGLEHLSKFFFAFEDFWGDDKDDSCGMAVDIVDMDFRMAFDKFPCSRLI